MKTKLMFLAVVALLMPGCTVIDKLETTLSNPVVLQSLAQTAVRTALKLEINHLMPAQVPGLLATLKAVDDSIKADAIPWFDGTKTAAVLTSTVDDILAKLKNNISGKVSEIISLCIAIIGANVPLPEIPSEALSEETKGAVLAVLKGLSHGLEMVIVEAGLPTPVVNPTARSAPAPLWPHKKK